MLEATLLPKLRVDFASFLSHGSLELLGILIPTTCVGLGYGLPRSLFLEIDIQDYHLGRSLGVLSGRYRSIQRTIPSVRTQFSPPSLLARAGTGILTRCPSTTPFGFALGPD